MKPVYKTMLFLGCASILVACNSEAKKLAADCRKAEVQAEGPASVVYGQKFKVKASLDNPDLTLGYCTWKDPFGTELNDPFAEAEYVLYTAAESPFLDLEATISGCDETKQNQAVFVPVMPDPACNLPANSLQLDGQSLQTGLVVYIDKQSDGTWEIDTYGAYDLAISFKPSASVGAYVADEWFNTDYLSRKVADARLALRINIGGTYHYAYMPSAEFPEGNVFLYDYKNGKRALIACDLPIQGSNILKRKISFHLLID